MSEENISHHQNNTGASANREDAQRKYKIISLFTGAGGMDIGLEKTRRFITLACVELEKPFCDTLRANGTAPLTGEIGGKA